MLEAAGAVVLRDESDGARSVLVVHRPRYDDWSLPKGHLDPGEGPAAAAEREVEEETGVRVRLGAALGTTRHTGPNGEKLVHWFVAGALEGDPAGRPADREVDLARGVRTDEADGLLTHPSDRELVLRALAAVPPARAPRLGAAPARHAQEVTAEAIGRRVSIRRLVEDPERGVVPSDVVGRLVGADDEALLVVDRAGHLTVIATAEVVASRLVPAHPRLPPEPLGGTPEHPLPREAARALVVADRRTLLIAHLPGDGATVWTAPGGGLDPGESHVDAVRRELTEEIGVTVEPGPWVWSRTAVFDFRGAWIEQHERWFLVELAADVAGTIDLARLPLADVGTAGARWFALDELAALDSGPGRVRVAPATLAVHLERLLAEGPPTSPIDVGR